MPPFLALLATQVAKQQRAAQKGGVLLNGVKHCADLADDAGGIVPMDGVAALERRLPRARRQLQPERLIECL